MIISNLAVLLAQRGLRTSKVSADTGISRTTLTALGQNRSVGIQLETLNSLCRYLQVTPEQILLYAPVELPGEVRTAGFGSEFSLEFELLVDDRGRIRHLLLVGEVNCKTEHTGSIIRIDIDYAEDDWDEAAVSILKQLPVQARRALDDLVSDAALEHLETNEVWMSDPHGTDIRWPFW